MAYCCLDPYGRGPPWTRPRWPNKTQHQHTHSFSLFFCLSSSARFQNSKLFCLECSDASGVVPSLPVYTEGQKGHFLIYACSTDAAVSQVSVNPGRPAVRPQGEAQV